MSGKGHHQEGGGGGRGLGQGNCALHAGGFRIQYFMRQNSFKVLCRQEMESVCLRITEKQTSES